MAEAVECTIVLPTYLEAENLRILLPRIEAIRSSLPLSTEVLVVDTTAAMDGSAAVCAANNVRYVNRSPTNDYGDAVRTAIREATGQWILFMDSDGSHAPEFIPKLIAEIGAADVVIASRYVAGGKTDNTWTSVLMSRALNMTYSLILNLPCSDVSNSFKIYRADLLKELDLRCRNFDIIEEVLFTIRRRHPNVRIKEIPFRFERRIAGKTKRKLLTFVATYLVTMVSLRLRAKR